MSTIAWLIIILIVAIVLIGAFGYSRRGPRV